MTCLEPAPTRTRSNNRPIIECARCHRDRPHKGRGLCSACYQSVLTFNRHELVNYPTTPRPTPARAGRIVECLRCEEDWPHWSRGLCQRCYNHVIKYERDQLEAYPSTVMSMDVDEVLVQRLVDWLIVYDAMSPAERLDYRSRRPARNRGEMTRGERIEVLRRTRYNVRPHVATRALGISGRKVPEYLTAAGIR